MFMGPQATYLTTSAPADTHLLLEPGAVQGNLSVGLPTFTDPMSLAFTLGNLRPIMQPLVHVRKEISEARDYCHLYLAATRTSNPSDVREFEGVGLVGERCEKEGCEMQLQDAPVFGVEWDSPGDGKV